MTNNTINVPRELLENIVLCYNEGEFELGTLAAECHALLSAPSPAGVDGLEVGDVECNCSWNPDSHDKTCPVYLRDRLSDAQAIFDGLRGEVARYRAVLDGAKYPNLDKLLSFSVEDCRFLGETVASMTISVQSERYQQARRIGELEGLLRDSAELIKHGVFEDGYCCCGSSVDSHGLGDGHSPVDALAYHAGQVCERIDAALSAGKEGE